MEDNILKEKLRNMNDKQIALIDHYCSNNMKELKIISKCKFKNYNLPLSEHDDLYDDAMFTLMESVLTFDDNKDASFATYLTNNIKKSIIDWHRNNYKRAVRRNLLRDEKGVIIRYDKDGNVTKDPKGNPVIIPDISFDAPVEDGLNLKETIASDYSIEEESGISFTDTDSDKKVKLFMDSLSDIQKNLLMMKMGGKSKDEIKEKLGLSNKRYLMELKSIRMNKNISLFTKNRNDGNYDMEVKTMAEDRIIEISEAESYRTDKYSMYSLIQDKKNGDMNCNYILQREPFQWTKEEANRYFCRLLSNLPIPEIVLCEQKKKGLTISHLIDGLQRLSYAEAFKENRMKIGTAGAERHLIQYREYKLDDNGNRIIDEDGLPEYELKVFDVIGKFYKDLPDELKKRFNNFNVNVTKFFDCTDEQIADHIRDYNNHASMNKEQGGLTKISAETANKIKRISQRNTFFKNCGKFTDNNKIKGKVERVVAEAIMLLFFRDSWKSNLEAIYKFVDENATEENFLKLNSHFNRFELALGENNESLKTLFTPTTMPMWIAVFDKFTTYNIDDSRFVDFLHTYNNELKEREIDGVSMADFKDQQTKKKATITGKIDLLVKLMNEFLNINEEDIENNDTERDELKIETEMTNKADENGEYSSDESILSFVKENVRNDIAEEDIELYEDMLNDSVKVDDPVYSSCQKALIAIIAYLCDIEKDDVFEEWLDRYKGKGNFSSNQKVNFNFMKNNIDRYIEAKGGAA